MGFRKDSVELALDGQGFMRTSVEKRMLTESLLCHAPDPQYPQAPMCGVQAIGELRDVAPIAATTGTASMATLFNSIASAHPTITRTKTRGGGRILNGDGVTGLNWCEMRLTMGRQSMMPFSLKVSNYAWMRQTRP